MWHSLYLEVDCRSKLLANESDTRTGVVADSMFSSSFKAFRLKKEHSISVKTISRQTEQTNDKISNYGCRLDYYKRVLFTS